MGSVKEYFSSLGKGVVSLVKGLEVTGKEFVTPKITERYPEDRDNMHVAQRFRAVLELIYDEEGNHRCIACGTCERNCPNGTITVESKMVDTWDGKKKKKLDRYVYDLGSCTFCQLCVTSCPTNALRFSNDFEQAVFTREKLVKQLNYLPEKPEPEPTPEQRARFEEEKKRKAEAAEAAAAAPAVELDEKALKAIEAAAGDPEKQAKLRAVFEKAARLKAEKAAAAKAAAAPAAAAPELDEKAKKALAAAGGDPEKEAKIRAALEKAARLKAQKAAAANTNDETKK